MNFSPYQPPPDAQRENALLSPNSTGSGSGKGKARVGASGSGKQKRPWFSRDASSFQGSYQSGADPSKSYTDQAYAYDPSSLDDPSSSSSYNNPSSSSSSRSGSGLPPTGQGQGQGGQGGNPNNVWESSITFLRVDVLAGLGYLGGPVAALLLLIFETTNDYVRFHAYQSGLLTTPIILLWLVMTLIGFWRWLRRLFLFSSFLVVLYTSFRAFRDPTNAAQPAGMGMSTGYLPRFYLPVIGDLAERWVGEE